MDYQNAEFYKLNKNTPDLVYNFADEVITYRKEEDKNGNLQIVEYRKKDGRKGKKTTTRRVVPSHEMSIEDFDSRYVTDSARERKPHKRTTAVSQRKCPSGLGPMSSNHWKAMTGVGDNDTSVIAGAGEPGGW